jgi:hypothetical protein
MGALRGGVRGAAIGGLAGRFGGQALGQYMATQKTLPANAKMAAVNYAGRRSPLAMGAAIGAQAGQAPQNQQPSIGSMFKAKPAAPAPASAPQNGPFGTNKGNPTALQSYGNTLDRWYNPWSKQQGLERGEEGLMRAGQGAMGVAGLAGGAALAPAAGLGVAGTPAAFTPASAAAYGATVGGLAAGQAGLQGAINGPRRP